MFFYVIGYFTAVSKGDELANQLTLRVRKTYTGAGKHCNNNNYKVIGAKDRAKQGIQLVINGCTEGLQGSLAIMKNNNLQVLRKM